MAYQTQPGTLPHRIVEHLRKLPAGSELSTAELCEAMAVEDHQVGSLTAWLKPAREAGVLKAELRRRATGRSLLFWSLGNGMPLPQDGEPDPLPVRRVRVPALAASPAPALKPAKPKQEAQPFNACRYIDGSVIMVGVEVREDGAVILRPAQARHVWALGGSV